MPELATIVASLNQRLGAIEAAQTAAQGAVHAALITAVVAAVAALLSFCGVLFNTAVLRRNGFVQTRATQQLKHAEFRQAWINALREEMARFLLLAVQTSTGAKKKSEAIHSMAMILMRMNRTDKHYDELVENMDRMLERSGRGDAANAIAPGTNPTADYLLTCQKILKNEWETTRTQMLEKPPRWRSAKELAAEKAAEQESGTGKVPRSFILSELDDSQVALPLVAQLQTETASTAKS